MKAVKKKGLKINKDYIKNILNKIKFFLLKAKNYIVQNKQIIYMSFPFIAMDLLTRFFGRTISFYKFFGISINLFTLSWIVFFLGIVLSFKRKIGKFIYLGTSILFMFFYLLNNVYYSMTSNFFSFNLLESASEGSPYIIDALKNCNPGVYVFLMLIVFLTIIGFKNIPNKKKFNCNFILKGTIIFILLHSIAPLFLGKADSDLVWSTWKNPRNVYNLYNDSNKSMRVSGLYEYTFRNFYVTFLKKQKTNEEDLEFLKEVYTTEKLNSENTWTGKFKDKNLIFLQLEGIDNWLITKKDTPTLYNMMNNSINFTNHYSFYNGGGSTFNSEFAANTGFIVPLSFTHNAYSFNKNEFPYSMPNIFKNLDYTVNAFHMNSGEYYSRSINYKNWGYDNYYGLIDMFKYTDESYKLDREMILNTKFSDLMFPSDTKFVDYIITYSTHLPFTNTKGVCKLLYNLDNEPLEESSLSSSMEFIQMSEEECARRQAKETDYMVKLLLEKLLEKDLLNNTAIVVFTDHYLYTLEDQSILSKYKTTTNHLINKTPFFIWNNGESINTVKSVTSQLNILPTTLNLFGIKYDTNNYIQTDALDSSYSGLVFFSDYSWFDGNVYVEGGEISNNASINENALNEKNYFINYLAKKNDLTLKYDYFKKIKK